MHLSVEDTMGNDRTWERSKSRLTPHPNLPPFQQCIVHPALAWLLYSLQYLRSLWGTSKHDLWRSRSTVLLLRLESCILLVIEIAARRHGSTLFLCKGTPNMARSGCQTLWMSTISGLESRCWDSGMSIDCVSKAHAKRHKLETTGSFPLISADSRFLQYFAASWVAVFRRFSLEIAGNRFLHPVPLSVCPLSTALVKARCR